MLTVEPYIAFQGTCKEAIAFYQSALAAKVLFCQTYAGSPMEGIGQPDQIMHATLQIGGSVVMMSDDANASGPITGGPISLTLATKDLTEATEVFNALSQGGKVILPLEKTFWAEAFGILTDKFGIQWMLNCTAD